MVSKKECSEDKVNERTEDENDLRIKERQVEMETVKPKSEDKGGRPHEGRGNRGIGGEGMDAGMAGSDELEPWLDERG